MNRNDTYKIANLDIKSWVGTVANASHYYAYIQFDGKDIDVKRILNVAEAKDLNNIEKLKYGEAAGVLFAPGENCRFFLSEESLIRVAKKIFHKEVQPKGAVAMVIGRAVTLDAKKIICVQSTSQKHLMLIANDLYKQIDALYNHSPSPMGWRRDADDDDVDYKKIDALEDEWWKIIGDLSK